MAPSPTGVARVAAVAGWSLVGLVGASALAAIALHRGEPLGASWLLVAAVASYLVAYRFYASFLAAKVLVLEDDRPTPAVRLEDGRDFVPTHRWIVLGHHFAAIAGPGPLVGPTLAAQFGYLPGTLWLVVGAVLAGCVQDFVVLFCSLRRDGRSLSQMAREELGRAGGGITTASVLAIMVILLAVVALVVVNALRDSPWGTFTLAATIPVALLMGLYLRYWRPGRVLEASLGGFALVLAAVVAGGWVADSPAWAALFTLSAPALALTVIGYGFAAAALPVWLLLAPRDYLSAIVKVGAMLALAGGILWVRPELQMPALTRFTDGSGPVFAGAVFPFCFITIACGAVSGFHALIASGTTPKLLMREGDARAVAYGSMLMESFVGVMALVAACSLQPGVYFAINSPAALVGSTPAAAAATISSWGFPVQADTLETLAERVGETTLLSRTGGAPSLAVGMAEVFSRVLGGDRLLDLWYHFAIMFEALFILTVLDAGTRVGRFMVQELLGGLHPALGRSDSAASALLASGLIVAAWGGFLYQGVLDPLGGINSLWPLFGISNQLLASVAFVVATTALVRSGRGRYALVTLLPLAWLVAVTMSGAWQKLFHADPRIGFLSQALSLEAGLAAGGLSPEQVAVAERMIFNSRLDAAVTALFAGLVLALLGVASRAWWRGPGGPAAPCAGGPAGPPP